MESMKFVGEKLREAFHLLQNLGGEAVAWFNGVLPPQTRAEKGKQWRVAVENSGAAGLAWLDKEFPPETRAEKIRHCLDVAKPYLAPAAALVVVVMLIRCIFGGGGGSGKTMKAPGRNYRMPRAGFESNPKGYFRNLRNDK